MKKNKLFFILSILIFLSIISLVSAIRMPIPGGDDGTWSTILNNFLNVSFNDSGKLENDTVSSFQILNGSILGADISSTTSFSIKGLNATTIYLNDINISTWISNINTTFNIQSLLNSTNIYSTYNSTYAGQAGNLTWNQSFADSLYWAIADGSYNATYAGYVSTYNSTYAAYASNVSRNWTLDTYTNWNTDWLSTYNATYAGKVSFPGFTNLLTDYSFTDNSALWNAYQTSLNTTRNIQRLLNSTSMTFAEVNGSSICINDVCIGAWSAVNSSSASDTNETTRVNFLNTSMLAMNTTLLSMNTTANIQNLLNSTGIYASSTDSNETTRVNFLNTSMLAMNTTLLSINTTANIQSLLNSTNIYSTYNATYHGKVSFPGFTDLLTDYSFTDNSALWDAYATNVSRNWTLDTYNNWNTDWLSTYNATYLAINLTSNIQGLLNYTGIYSTYNASYWNTALDLDTVIGDDEIAEGKIAFGTTCAAGSHYYLNGNDLACETDDYNAAFDSEDEIEAVIFDADNTADLGMGGYNITATDCIKFESGGMICSGV